jgi:hypothetical protein
MKLIFFLLLALPTKASITVDSLPYGTVIYSMLPPKDFIKKNPDWMLMDGGDSVTSRKVYGTATGAKEMFAASRLHTEGDVEDFPDARGLFIRGMNLGREVDSGDADGDRKVAVKQSDTFKKHDHGGGVHGHGFTSSTTMNDWGGNVVVGGSAGGQPRAVSSSSKVINAEGNDETRPRNLSLYIYIKVN